MAPDTLDYTTLGRGGSDTSGVAVGVALGAARVEIFTDVDGVAIADPRIFPGARILARVSYEAMYELARFGAKVVHPRALATGWTRRTPIVVRSTFSDAPGTRVDDVDDERPLVGLAALPPMDTLVLPPGTVSAATRETWERSRLVMSIVDTDRGEVVVGAADDRAAGLRDALREAAPAPARSLGRCCWLSVVADPSALAGHHARWMTRFGLQAIGIHARELAGRRCSYVVPEAMRPAAAHVLYETIAEQV